MPRVSVVCFGMDIENVLSTINETNVCTFGEVHSALLAHSNEHSITTIFCVCLWSSFQATA